MSHDFPKLPADFKIPKRVLIFEESFDFAFGPQEAWSRINRIMTQQGYDVAINIDRGVIVYLRGNSLDTITAESPSDWTAYLEAKIINQYDARTKILLTLYVDAIGQMVMAKERRYWKKFLAEVKAYILSNEFDFDSLKRLNNLALVQNLALMLVFGFGVLISTFLGMKTGVTGFLVGIVLTTLPFLWAKYIDK